jgi:hypothetical protein
MKKLMQMLRDDVKSDCGPQTVRIGWGMLCVEEE